MTSKTSEKTKLFISYSRKDRGRIERLYDALASEEDLRVFRDTDDILPTEEWKPRLEKLIRESDTIIFALSPASAASEVCAWELELAASLNKRIIPIVVENVDGAVPEAVSKLNYIFLTEADDFGRGLTKIQDAISLDIDWVREHTRLGELADRWEKAVRLGAQPLRGKELEAAERWLVEQPKNAPQPTELQRRYILESRKAATRRARITVMGSIAAMLIVGVLGVFAWLQRGEAVAQKLVAEAETQRAELAQVEAETQRGEAVAQKAVAEAEKSRAELARQDAETQRDAARIAQARATESEAEALVEVAKGRASGGDPAGAAISLAAAYDRRMSVAPGETPVGASDELALLSEILPLSLGEIQIPRPEIEGTVKADYVSLSDAGYVAASYTVKGNQSIKRIVVVWQIAEKKELLRITLESDTFVKVGLSSDGRYLAYSSYESATLVVVDVQTKNTVFSDPVDTLKGSVMEDFRFYPVGSNLVAVSFNGTIAGIDVKNGAVTWRHTPDELGNFPQKAWLSQLQVSTLMGTILLNYAAGFGDEKSKFIAIRASDGRIIMHTAPFPPMIKDVHLVGNKIIGYEDGSPHAIPINPTTFEVSDRTSGPEFETLSTYLPVFRPITRFMPSVNLAANAPAPSKSIDGAIYWTGKPNGEADSPFYTYDQPLLQPMRLSEDSISSSAFQKIPESYSVSSDGRWIAYTVGLEGRIAIFPLTTRKWPSSFDTYTGADIALINAPAASGNVIASLRGEYWLLSSEDWKSFGRLFQLPLPSGTEVARLVYSQPSKNGRFLMALGKAVFLIDPKAETMTKIFETTAGDVMALAWSADEERIVTGSEWKVAQVWSGQDYKHLGDLKGHGTAVTGVWVSDDGNSAITYNGFVRTWSLKTFEGSVVGGESEVENILRRPTPIVSNERFVAIGGMSGIWIAQKTALKSWRNVATPVGPVVFSLAFLDEENTLAVGTREELSIYDANLGVRLFNLTDKNNVDFQPVAYISFDPSSKKMSVSGRDFENADGAEIQNILAFSLEGTEQANTLEHLCRAVDANLLSPELNGKIPAFCAQ